MRLTGHLIWLMQWVGKFKNIRYCRRLARILGSNGIRNGPLTTIPLSNGPLSGTLHGGTLVQCGCHPFHPEVREGSWVRRAPPRLITAKQTAFVDRCGSRIVIFLP